MIRKATAADIAAVSRIYEDIHTEEEAGRIAIGWKRGVYPTAATAIASLEKGTLFVLEENGTVYAAAKIDREEVPVYALANWEYDAAPSEIMVLHTLVVSPSAMGKGYGRQFVAFYEQYAAEHGCRYLRIDTNERNSGARKMYAKLGYKEIDTVPCVFNGIPGVRLVCLEKKI